ncbi:MAG: hypothetical protein HOO93_17865 [Methyloglobulus sp.]|nr:hypothetical protein [Methyloglobulus sp.]
MSDNISAALFERLYEEDANAKLKQRQKQVNDLDELKANLAKVAKQAEVSHAERQKKIVELENALKATKEESGNLQRAEYQNCQRILKEIETAKLELVKTAPSYIQHCWQAVKKDLGTVNTTEKIQAVNQALGTFNGWYYQAMDFSAMNEGFKKAVEELSPSDA